MSDLDQSLADSSLATLPRISRQPDAAIAAGVILNPTAGDSPPLEVRVEHKFSSKIKAQFIFNKQSNGSYSIFAAAENLEHYKRFFKVLRKIHQKNELRSVAILRAVDNSTTDSGPRIILNRSKEIVFRPSSKVAFGVDLDNIELPNNFPIIHEFDYSTRTNRRLHPVEAANRMRAKFESQKRKNNQE